MKKSRSTDELYDFYRHQNSRDQILNEIENISSMSDIKFLMASITIMLPIYFLCDKATASVLTFIAGFQFILIILIFSRLTSIELKFKKAMEILHAKD